MAAGTTSSTPATVVFPGDNVLCFDAVNGNDTQQTAVKLGPGLFYNDHQQAIVVKAGFLQHPLSTRKWWVESNQKRYIPAAGETVVGIVISQLAEAFRVDIGSAHPAVLPMMAFEGASKRNKSSLMAGVLVYARVSVASKDMDPELECVNPVTGKSDGFGELKDGFMFRTSLAHARSLRTTQNSMVGLLSSHMAFELASGMNGWVWVKAATASEVIIIVNALKASESMSVKQMEESVKEITKKMKNR